MEAPKKLYVSDYGSETMYNWHPERLAVKDIEYIRKDALIEKACDAYCKVCGHFAHSVPTHICRHDCKYFSDFKKYMEG
jgi:hypothetical protein